MKRLEETEKLLIQCEKEAKELREIHKRIKEIEKNLKKLGDYYDNQYLKDFEQFPDEKYGILDEDSIWNVLTEQYQEKIAISKTIINSI